MAALPYLLCSLRLIRAYEIKYCQDKAADSHPAKRAANDRKYQANRADDQNYDSPFFTRRHIGTFNALYARNNLNNSDEAGYNGYDDKDRAKAAGAKRRYRRATQNAKQSGDGGNSAKDD